MRIRRAGESAFKFEDQGSFRPGGQIHFSACGPRRGLSTAHHFENDRPNEPRSSRDVEISRRLRKRSSLDQPLFARTCSAYAAGKSRHGRLFLFEKRRGVPLVGKSPHAGRWLDRLEHLSRAAWVRGSGVVGGGSRSAFGMDGSDVSGGALRLVRSQRPARAAAYDFVAVQWRAALCAVEWPPCQRDGAGRGDCLFSLRSGGIGGKKSTHGEGCADVSPIAKDPAAGG